MSRGYRERLALPGNSEGRVGRLELSDSGGRTWPTRRTLRRILALILFFSILVLLTGSWTLSGKAGPTTLSARQRYGFVATSSNWRQDYDSTQIGAGWVVDFAHPACSTRPGGVDLAIALDLQSGARVNPGWLGPLVDSHPGSMWLLGNEPDCIWQGNIVPEEYAHIYHEFYTFIKGRDPTSMVAPGGIVQATPLRFQWLNRVLETYQQSYGTKMPVDVWNIHNAIVNEKKGGWGAEIPPGIDAEEGRILPNDFHDNDNMDIFRQQIRAFRQWMKDNGYGGYSLIISEFGVLMPEILGFDAARVNAFMSATFDYLQNATDPNLGDPNDGYRLVQRWAWFSLDFPAYDPAIGYGFNGNLFDPQSATLTPMGYHYAQHTSGLPAVTHVDLALEGVVPSLLFKPILPGETVTRTVYVKVANHGNLNSGSFNVRLQSDGPVDYVLEETVANLAPGAETLLSFVLPDLPLGNYWLNARVDTEESVVESAECNNQAARAMMVPSHLLILPLVSH